MIVKTFFQRLMAPTCGNVTFHINTNDKMKWQQKKKECRSYEQLQRRAAFTEGGLLRWNAILWTEMEVRKCMTLTTLTKQLGE